MQIKFNFYPGGKKKALTMSYDDGHIHDRRLVEIFNCYDIKGTFHLNTGKLDSRPYLNSQELMELFKDHEVSAHTLNHPFLSLVPHKTVVDEILKDKIKLEELTGSLVRGMSYPYGDYTAEMFSVLTWLGMEYARAGMSNGRYLLPENFMWWQPTCHHGQASDKLDYFINCPEWEQMPLFYVWGHSYEFEMDGNWNLIEEFCKAVAFDETVWYATNIEIKDYVTALRNLIFSADSRTVFNPSCMDVWVGVDGEPVKVEPGKQIKI